MLSELRQADANLTLTHHARKGCQQDDYLLHSREYPGTLAALRSAENLILAYEREAQAHVFSAKISRRYGLTPDYHEHMRKATIAYKAAAKEARQTEEFFAARGDMGEAETMGREKSRLRTQTRRHMNAYAKSNVRGTPKLRENGTYAHKAVVARIVNAENARSDRYWSLMRTRKAFGRIQPMA